MSKQGNMIYLGLCGRNDPPLIGVYYKNKQKDGKNKVYTILLHKLIFNPKIDEVVNQLYREHPHILKQDKIPKQKIARIFEKIQEKHKDQQQYDNQQFQDDQPNVQKGQKRRAPPEFDFQDQDQHPALNRSH